MLAGLPAGCLTSWCADWFASGWPAGWQAGMCTMTQHRAPARAWPSVLVNGQLTLQLNSHNYHTRTRKHTQEHTHTNTHTHTNYTPVCVVTVTGLCQMDGGRPHSPQLSPMLSSVSFSVSPSLSHLSISLSTIPTAKHSYWVPVIVAEFGQCFSDPVTTNMMKLML